MVPDYRSQVKQFFDGIAAAYTHNYYINHSSEIGLLFMKYLVITSNKQLIVQAILNSSDYQANDAWHRALR